MNRKKALDIFDIEDNYTESELKKRYRSLMVMTHPDSANDHQYPYDASDINAAYEYLLNNRPVKSGHIHKTKDNQDDSNYRNKKAKEHDQHPGWSAPINNNAYAPREIYHNIEDADGVVIGKTIVDTGKYMWSKEEEFPLFLSSIYNCSKSIIAEKCEELLSDINVQAQIAYLLAQQYTDPSMLQDMITQIGEEDGQAIYLIDCMVEDIALRSSYSEGEYLYPARISRHRLYVKNDKDVEVGYLSFVDDRLYYWIIPLFERRAAQIKLQIMDATIKKQNKRRYISVSMMLKQKKENTYQIVEDINQVIDRLLHI